MYRNCPETDLQLMVAASNGSQSEPGARLPSTLGRGQRKELWI